MWKDYSASYLKNNRSASISVMAAAFTASLFLSLLCCLCFNLWRYDVDRIIQSDGGWHARITANSGKELLPVIETFANVESAAVNETFSDEHKTVVDIRFHHPKTVYSDVPLIAAQLGLEADEVQYHEYLLSRYFVYDPNDETPPLLLVFYLLVLCIASVALILIIQNAFAVTMHARIHQFGILSSIGATPRQIRTCLLQEASMLCSLPILAGDLLGIVLSFGILQTLEFFLADIGGRQSLIFQYHPLILAGTVLLSVLTVLFSAWIPAGKLSRITPLEAIRGGGNLTLKRQKHTLILSALFGIEGTLAGNSLKIYRKSLRTTMLSLTLSFFAFSLFLNFTALSRLSVYETSFSKYQDFWDIMATVKDTPIAQFEGLEALSALENTDSAVAYQKATAYTAVSADTQSKELLELGGLSALAGESVKTNGGDFLVKVPIVVLDDAGFAEYCKQIGTEAQTDGGIVINKIWDSLHTNFRRKAFIPFIEETADVLTLQNRDGSPIAELPVISYTEKEPVLWEQYDNYSLVQVLPLSVWNTFSEKVADVEPDTVLRILNNDDTALDKEMAKAAEILAPYHTVEIHNRVRDLAEDNKKWQGLIAIMSAGCLLLAMIGIANIFTHTFGFLRQRKREFAQYLSVGVTPKGLRKILLIEALSIAGKPVLITLPLTIAADLLMIKASYLEISTFLPVAPVRPLLAYIAAIFFFVGLAYYLGGRRILNCNLSEALRTELVD